MTAPSESLTRCGAHEKLLLSRSLFLHGPAHRAHGTHLAPVALEQALDPAEVVVVDDPGLILALLQHNTAQQEREAFEAQERKNKTPTKKNAERAEATDGLHASLVGGSLFR